MVIMEIAQDDLLDEEKLDNFLETTLKASIPIKTHQFLQSEDNRKILLDKYGKESFLLPEELKFPIIDYKTGKIDCKLLYAARIRARQWKKKDPKYINIAKKAEELYNKSGCNKRIHVKLREHDEVYDLYDILDLIKE